MIKRIANIVRTVREREACSIDDLAARSGVPLPILDALERGQPGISTSQLDDVARALSVDPIALLDGRDVPKVLPSVFLRHSPMQDFNANDSTVLDEAIEQGRSLANLRALLGESPSALQEGLFEHRSTSTDRPEAPAQEGYRLAGQVRKWLGNSTEPLGDMGDLLEQRFGIAVVVRTLETSRATAVSVRAQPGAAIVLNDRDPQRAANPLLTRVYLAHELGHVLFDPSQGGLHIVIDIAADRKVQAAEQRARAFAAELLLPLEGLRRLLGDPRVVRETGAAQDLVARARARFGTPHEIAVNHLCNLNFVDRQLRDWLEAAGTTFAGSPPEMKLPIVGAPSRLVAVYVERTYREGFLTDGEARGILGLGRLAPLPWDETAL